MPDIVRDLYKWIKASSELYEGQCIDPEILIPDLMKRWRLQLGSHQVRSAQSAQEALIGLFAMIQADTKRVGKHCSPLLEPFLLDCLVHVQAARPSMNCCSRWRLLYI